MADDMAEGRVADRLESLKAIRAGQRDPHRLVDILLAVEDPATAADRLVAELGLSRRGAVAVLDMQFRRLSGRDRALIDAEIEEIEGESRTTGDTGA